MKSQSAMEYLVTYGWAILVIAIILVTLSYSGVFKLGVLNSGSCIAEPGFLCNNPILDSVGGITLNFGESSFLNMQITGLACSNNNTVPAEFTPYSTTLLSGQIKQFIFLCNINSLALGTPFSGYLWIQYDPSNLQTSMIGTVNVKVEGSPSVEALGSINISTSVAVLGNIGITNDGKYIYLPSWSPAATVIASTSNYHISNIITNWNGDNPVLTLFGNNNTAYSLGRIGYSTINTITQSITNTIYDSSGCGLGYGLLYNNFLYSISRCGDTIETFNIINNQLVNSLTLSTANPSFCSMNVTPGGSFLYLGDCSQRDDNITIINTQTFMVSNVIAVPRITTSILMPGNGYAYTINYDGYVKVIATSNQVLVDTINLPQSPASGSCFDKSNNYIYIYTGSGYLLVFNIQTNTVIKMISVGSGSDGCVLTPNNEYLFVSNYNSDTVSVINTALNQVMSTVRVGNGPGNMAVSPNGDYVYVVNTQSNNVTILGFV